ncbi:unnamed protein product [Caenorhabditis auriculariae]|uniref:Acyl-coenzyme A oxidase n=1 Tax=Caenorhabditis auriculariae TaxID=2777116 RepID=A0A8S1H7S8_9PELO|nr:unnamed protein product [Caenorhabditis auriculariae]
MLGRNRQMRPGDNPELTSERLKCTFDTDILAAELNGGVENLAKMREIQQEVGKRTELWDASSPTHMSRIQKIENACRKLQHLFEVVSDIAPSDFKVMFSVLRTIFGIEGFPLALHSLMFVPTIQNQADDEQQEWWLMDAAQARIIGAYAQSELGHGTNLNHIETTATFDVTQDEFVVHTPTTTALKWWPGGMGVCATHVILVANLVIDGKNHGPHSFFVPVRDVDTHQPLPGVRVGDIGSKMGMNCFDNGYLGFDQFRIPRRNMLMRHYKVSREGVYTAPSHPKVGYSTMLYVRSEIVFHQAQFMFMALMIAVRYSAIRRQGEITPGAGEVRILDYQTQQFRLFPYIARAFASLAAAEKVQHLTELGLRNVKNGGNTEVLADLHALSCGLKSVVTHTAAETIEQARMACGGHGYSDASYLPTIYTCAVGACTYEGENIVLLLQVAKYLMKGAKAAAENRPLVGKPLGKHAPMIKHFEHVARKRIALAYELLKGELARGVDKEHAFARHAVDMSKAARAHTKLFIASAFVCRAEAVADPAVRLVFDQLVELHLNYELGEMAEDVLQDGYMSSDELRRMRQNVYVSFEKIRPNAVSIVDSFDIPDRELRSVLGRRDAP